MKLYILNYNNYFNRKLLKLDKIADYADYIVLTADNISFNPNDGRQTNQILNKYESGDYLICTESKETTVNGYVIDLSNSLSLALIRDFTNPKITAIDAYNYANQIGTGKVLFDTFISKLQTLTTLTSTSINDWLEKDIGEEYNVISKEDVTTTAETINSRWFILEANRNRQGQYSLSLKRDVLADNLDVIEDAPMFVEKAMLSDTDKMIINNEGMQFNQIKTNEILLKDKSNCPWIVGYVDKNLSADRTTISYKPDAVRSYVTLSDIASNIGTTEDILANLIAKPGESPIEAWFTDKFILKFKIRGNYTDFVQYDQTYDAGWNYKSTYGHDGDYTNLDSLFYVYGSTSAYWRTKANATEAIVKKSIQSYQKDIIADLPSLLNRSYYLTTNQLESLKEYEGKTILYLGSYYKLKINEISSNTYNIGPSAYGQFMSIATAITNADYQGYTTPRTAGELILRPTEKKVNLYLKDVEEDTIETIIPSSRKILNKEAFDMFAIPCGSLSVSTDDDFVSCSEDIAMNIASAMALSLNDECYDVQLLPYCPVQDLLTDYMLDLSNLTENQDYQYITAATATESANYSIVGYTSKSGTTYTKTYTFIGLTDVKVQKVTRMPGITSVVVDSWSQSENTLTIIFTALTESDAALAAFKVNYTHTVTNKHVGVILWLTDNRFNVKINQALSLTHSMKVESQVDTYRLCSPNYQGSFDFNVAKNGGNVEYFQADCTYKPYNPYIRVYPKFDWLYGSNFSDARGLICGGDFSLPRVTSAWETYQLQNKNYQNTFNRDIQHLDFNNSLTMRNQVASAITGIVQDTAKGAQTGAMVGGGWGAAIGGVIAGGASTVGAITDTDTLARQQRESKQLSIDKYNYQLGNIQALPYTISKVGSFDINSKLYPFIEYYTASEEEVKALEDKITYESMTVMRIGTLSEFKRDEASYIKGQLIRLDNLHTDTNLINDIYTELYKGVYY